MSEGKVVAFNPDGTVNIEDDTGLYCCELGVRRPPNGSLVQVEFIVREATQIGEPGDTKAARFAERYGSDARSKHGE